MWKYNSNYNLQSPLFQKLPKSHEHFFKNHEYLSLEGSSARSIGVRGRGTLDQAHAMRHGKFVVVRERRKSLGNQWMESLSLPSLLRFFLQKVVAGHRVSKRNQRVRSLTLRFLPTLHASFQKGHATQHTDQILTCLTAFCLLWIPPGTSSGLHSMLYKPIWAVGKLPLRWLYFSTGQHDSWIFLTVKAICSPPLRSREPNGAS